MAASPQQPVFRFAPSPNGRLHLGHALSALTNERMAREAGGRLLLRIEDVDTVRARAEHVAAIRADLEWLGIGFEAEPRRQSEHLAAYGAALARLERDGFAYPSTISRKEIAALAHAPGWPRDPEGAPLPPPRALGDASAPHAIRLDMARAAAAAGPLAWNESGAAHVADPAAWGDVVLKSRDGIFAYHLAVVVDDAAQGVTHVVRGRDLFAATAIHRVLQTLLGLPAPAYHHHRLILDEGGEKLSKSRDAPTLASLREAGVTPAEIRARLGFG